MNHSEERSSILLSSSSHVLLHYQHISATLDTWQNITSSPRNALLEKEFSSRKMGSIQIEQKLPKDTLGHETGIYRCFSSSEVPGGDDEEPEGSVHLG